MNNKTKGKPRPEEVRRKISEGKKGKPASEYARRRASETHKGKVISDYQKRRISEKTSKPVECINTKTGEVLKFSSIRKCAEHFNWDYNYTGFRCRNNKEYQGWLVKFINKNLKIKEK